MTTANANQIKFKVRATKHTYRMVQQLAAGNYVATGEKFFDGKFTIARYADAVTSILYETIIDTTYNVLRGLVLYGKNGNSIKFVPTSPQFPEELTAAQIVKFRNFLGFCSENETPPAEKTLVERISILEEQNKNLAERIARLERLVAENKNLEERFKSFKDRVGI